MYTGSMLKEIYVDSSGEFFYSVDGNKQVKNFEGIIKVDDFNSFEKGMVKIKNPMGLLEFLAEELNVKVLFN